MEQKYVDVETRNYKISSFLAPDQFVLFLFFNHLRRKESVTAGNICQAVHNKTLIFYWPILPAELILGPLPP